MLSVKKRKLFLCLQSRSGSAKMHKSVNMPAILNFLFVHLLLNFSNNFVVEKCLVCSAYISTPNKP